MLNNVCLLPKQIDKLKEAFRDGKTSVPALMKMSTKQRTQFFAKYGGESAQEINLAFEQKLILKHDVQGVVNLINKLIKSGKYKPATVAKLEQAKVEYRAKQQERIFSPKEKEKFLEDLAEKTFGAKITEAEAKQVLKLQKQSAELFKKYDPESRVWTSPEDKASYGASKVIETKYLSELKEENVPWREALSDRYQEFKVEPYKPKAFTKLGADALRTITNNSIALVASVDNSFIGRQGINVLMTHPSIWWDGAGKSFDAFAKEIGGTNAMDALMADIFSDPNYIDGSYKTAGILDTFEEQFPTSLPEQVPYAGRVFKGSESAFKGSSLVMRTKLYNLYSDMARTGGIKMDKVQIEDLGKIVNSLTARGKWGKYGESPIVKLILWAPRMIKANLDLLTAHGLGTGLKTPFARKQAAKNWLKQMTAILVFLGTVNAGLKKAKLGYVEWNPLSSEFGKVVINSDTKKMKILGTLADFVGISSDTKNGKTTFDFTGGKGSYITLAARFLLNKSKSAASGITTEGGSGFGLKSRFEYVIDFLTGKTVPMIGAAINFAKGSDYSGNKPTIRSTAYNIGTPITIKKILSIFGIGENPPSAEWSESESKELNSFKEKIGEKEFEKANDQFDQRVNDTLKELYKVDSYKAKSDEDKQKAITKVKADIKKDIFNQYGFDPTPPKPKAPKKKSF